MLCHNHYDLMPFATSGESHLRYGQDNRKESHGNKDVVVVIEPTLQPKHAANFHAMPCGGNSVSNLCALANAECAARTAAKKTR
jgi:hypothetical protein